MPGAFWMKRSLVLLLGGALALLAGLQRPGQAQSADVIYSLNTTCSLGKGKPQPCQVEAVEVGEATEYRHRLGARTISYLILEDPYVRIEGRKAAGAPWTSVRNAWINFTTNELCFNDRAFCVVNPTFLAESRGAGAGL